MLQLNKIYNQDCKEGMKLLPDNSISSIVTDPPYGLSKEPNIVEVLTNWLNNEEYIHNSKGFMNVAWDSFVPNPSIWKEAYRVLKPGGYLLCFAGTRTYDLMCISLRLAVFEIRDQIDWIYSTGFPKSMNISKEMEKRRCKVNIGEWILKRMELLNLDKKDVAKHCNVTPRQIDHWIGINTPCPQNPNEKRYLLLEEILQDKPYFREQFISKKGKKIGEIVHQRSGGNDFAKIVGSQSNSKTEELFDLATEEAKQWSGYGTSLKPAHEPIIVARKPLSEKTIVDNVLKWNTGGINIDDCRVEYIKNDDPRIGKNYQHNAKAGLEIGNNKDNSSGEKQQLHNNQGRFPANIIMDEEAGKILDSQSGIRPSGKGNGNAETGIVTNGQGVPPLRRGKLISRDDTGGASRFFKQCNYDDNDYEANFMYCAKASKKERGEGNNHPTVKPLSLIKYLVTLVTPPKGICLDPFEGSGTTFIACRELGFDHIGFEMNKDYCDIAEKRLNNKNI